MSQTFKSIAWPEPATIGPENAEDKRSAASSKNSYEPESPIGKPLVGMLIVVVGILLGQAIVFGPSLANAKQPRALQNGGTWLDKSGSKLSIRGWTQARIIL